MKLEWDETKRARTLADRGLDFVDIVTAEWDTALTAEDARGDYGEVRFVTMAKINTRLCVFAWCWRGSAPRVISLRKANAKERKYYEEALDQA